MNMFSLPLQSIALLLLLTEHLIELVSEKVDML